MQVSVITDSLLSIKGDEEIKGRDGERETREIGRDEIPEIQYK